MAFTGRSEDRNVPPNVPDLVNLLMSVNFVILGAFIATSGVMIADPC